MQHGFHYQLKCWNGIILLSTLIMDFSILIGISCRFIFPRHCLLLYVSSFREGVDNLLIRYCLAVDYWAVVSAFFIMFGCILDNAIIINSSWYCLDSRFLLTYICVRLLVKPHICHNRELNVYTEK